MAAMDPELAFLESQKEYDPAGDYTIAAVEQPAPTGDEDDEEEYDPSTVYPAYPGQDVPSPSDQSASMPESAVNTPPVAEGSLKLQPADVAASTPSKQPRTMGGFVVESDDDEDEVPVQQPQAAGTALLSANGVSNSPQRSLSHSPSNTLAPTNVPVHSAQDLGNSGVPSSHPIAANVASATQSPALPNGRTHVSDVTKTLAPDVLNAASARPSTAPVTPEIGSMPKPRLPQDRVGIFEDRIAEDPRGDIEAWLSLIEEHRRRHKIEDARAVYDRFFKIFPTAAEQWNDFINMELELEDLSKVERLFERSIASNPHVNLWSTYINYTRRIHNVTTDENRARTVITQVYEFVLDDGGIGIDVHSGRIWLDYIEFIKSGPGTLGGTTWQDKQKMDTLRKVYQRAVAIPTNATLEIWRDYDKFEMTLNKITGRKNLQEKSPYYMTARSANNVLENLTKHVNRTTLPKLPPMQGFDGYDEYMTQVKLWKAWIQYEKDDPLVLKDDNRDLYNKRVVYLYKQALMSLRFWPELWYDAAEWCYENNLSDKGNDFLTRGIDANPESCLLAFRRAHQIELKGEFEEGEAGIIKKGDAVREPFNRVLDELYDLTNKTKKREEHSLARAKEAFATQQAAEDAARAMSKDSDEEGDEEVKEAKRRKDKEAILQTQLQAISAGYNAQVKTLKRTISYAWIALMRSMRRIQGKGRPDPPAGTAPGFRGIFAEARRKGKLLSDAYVASALIEHHCYQDAAATKIFDRGMKLFPDDENFALEYIQHLVKQNDATNARAVFETVVSKLTSKPESTPRSKLLFAFFHKYESQYGDLTQIVKLEKRMNDLFPEDPQLARFSERYSAPSFDPTSTRPIISPRSQMKPALPNVLPTVEVPPATLPQQVQEPPRASPVIHSPRAPPPLVHVTNSPKRPFEDIDNELAQPRKVARGESPLKGAAGRRLDAARRNQARNSEGVSNLPNMQGPAPLPHYISFILNEIPNAGHYYASGATRFNAERLVALLRATDLPLSVTSQPPPPTQTPIAPPMAQPPPFMGQPPMGQSPVNPWCPPPPSGYYGR